MPHARPPSAEAVEDEDDEDSALAEVVEAGGAVRSRECSAGRRLVSESAPVRTPDAPSIPFHARLRRFVTARNLRLASGLVMSFFVATHLVNHALGLISLDVLEAGRAVFLGFWRGTPAGSIFFASMAIHLGLAYHAIYRRRGWRMPVPEAVQLLLGIAIPPLLLIHVLGTAVNSEVFGTDDTYAYVLLALWVHDPAVARQIMADKNIEPPIHCGACHR